MQALSSYDTEAAKLREGRGAGITIHAREFILLGYALLYCSTMGGDRYHSILPLSCFVCGRTWLVFTDMERVTLSVRRVPHKDGTLVSN